MTPLPTSQFRIEPPAEPAAVTTPQPNDVQHEPRPLAGYSLRGAPVYQGYEAQTWAWRVLHQSEMTRLYQLYNPLSPQVRITFLDPATGAYVTRFAMMHAPRIGRRMTVLYLEVSLLFTHLTEAIDG